MVFDVDPSIGRAVKYEKESFWWWICCMLISNSYKSVGEESFLYFVVIIFELASVRITRVLAYRFNIPGRMLLIESGGIRCFSQQDPARSNRPESIKIFGMDLDLFVDVLFLVSTCLWLYQFSCIITCFLVN